MPPHWSAEHDIKVAQVQCNGRGELFLSWEPVRIETAFAAPIWNGCRAHTRRESKMADEKKEPWLNQMALATLILAVCATLSTYMFLQAAILLNSIAGLMKIKKVWWSSIPVGLTGIGFLAIF
jgi:hypothetical protein